VQRIAKGENTERLCLLRVVGVIGMLRQQSSGPSPLLNIVADPVCDPIHARQKCVGYIGRSRL
jgi:hypothetical protein